MNHQALARTWRPRTFQDIVGQMHVRQALSNSLTMNRLHHAYLISGPHGVGKTSIGRIFAKCLNCEQGISSTPCNQCSTCNEIDQGRFIDVLEVDAASKTKVEDTRELIDNVHYFPTRGRFKIYLIDEVHMLSGHSFNALLKTLEEPPAHVKFFLATTDPQRLPVTVLSRCLQFKLKLVTDVDIQKHLATILEQEKIPFEINALARISQAASGSMRDALSLLDQALAFTQYHITETSICTLLGHIDQNILWNLLEALAQQNGYALLETIEQIAQLTTDFTVVLEELLILLHDISIAQLVPDNINQAQSFANRFSKEEVQLYYQIGLIGRRDLSLAPTPRSGFEMILLRMLAFNPTTHSTTSPMTETKKIKSVTSPSPEKKPIGHTGDPSWPDIIKKLNLTGAALALINHCNLVRKTDTVIELSLSAHQAPLLNAKLEQRIADALNQFFNQSLQVSIFIETKTTSTVSSASLSPAAIQEQQNLEAQQALEKKIAIDDKIQAFLNNFDGKIQQDSVNTNDS